MKEICPIKIEGGVKVCAVNSELQSSRARSYKANGTEVDKYNLNV